VEGIRVLPRKFGLFVLLLNLSMRLGAVQRDKGWLVLD